ncbi:unnamed protein product [Chrysoparadoxa australica]
MGGGAGGGGLDGLDAFASQGFKKQDGDNESNGTAQNSTNPPGVKYTNVPLNQIPAKAPAPAAVDPFTSYQGGQAQQQPFATAGAPMGFPPQPQQQQVPQAAMMGQGAAGMHPMQPMFNTAQPAMMMPPQPMMGQYQSMAGGMMMPPQQQQQQHPFATSAGTMQPFGMPQAQPAAPQQQVNPLGGTDPFSTAPPAPSGPAPAAPATAGNSAWDPFGTNAAAQPVPSVAAAAPAQQQAWDPFSGGAPPAQPGAAAAAAPAAADKGWGDLSDADIWGDQTKGDLPSGNNDDGEDDWSDDDASQASDDGDSRSPSPSPVRNPKQVESDFEMALRLQREEENNVGASSRGGDMRGGQRSTGDKPDGECLARISVRTLLVKRWKPIYFIFELPDLLLLYRSRDDYIYNPKGTMIKKRIELKHNHTLTQLKRKVYKDYGYLWHFTVEEQLDYGPSVVVKFAHHERRPLEEVGNRIAEAIREKRRTRARMNTYGGAPRAPTTAVYGDRGRGADANYGRRSEYESRPSSSAYGSSAGGGGYNRGGAGGSADRDKYSKWGSLS